MDPLSLTLVTEALSRSKVGQAALALWFKLRAARGQQVTSRGLAKTLATTRPRLQASLRLLARLGLVVVHENQVWLLELLLPETARTLRQISAGGCTFGPDSVLTASGKSVDWSPKALQVVTSAHAVGIPDGTELSSLLLPEIHDDVAIFPIKNRGFELVRFEPKDLPARPGLVVGVQVCNANVSPLEFMYPIYNNYLVTTTKLVTATKSLVNTPNLETQSNSLFRDARDLFLLIFSYWAERMNYPSARLTPGRRGHIAARLAEGFTLEDFRTVIDYVAGNAFLRGNNTRGRAYDDFSTFARSGDRMTRYLELAASGQQDPRQNQRDLMASDAPVEATWL